MFKNNLGSDDTQNAWEPRVFGLRRSNVFNACSLTLALGGISVEAYKPVAQRSGVPGRLGPNPARDGPP